MTIPKYKSKTSDVTIKNMDIQAIQIATNIFRTVTFTVPIKNKKRKEKKRSTQVLKQYNLNLFGTIELSTGRS